MKRKINFIFILFLIVYQYDSLSQENYFPILSDGLWGFINYNGTVVIPPQFLQAKHFTNGFAFVKVGEIKGNKIPNDYFINDIGYINRRGEFRSILGFFSGFEEAGSFREERARVKLAGKGLFSHSKWGFIDTSFNQVIKPGYTNVGDFSEGLAWMEKKERFLFIVLSDTYGYINLNGEVVIPNQFEQAGNFYEGFANITLNDKKGFIDRNGNIVIKPRFESVKYFSQCLAPVKFNGKWGFVNREDSLIINPTYEDAFSFSEGLALVKQAGKWGFIDTLGKLAIPLQFDNASAFTEGLAPALSKDKWGYIDASGSFVIQPQFDYAYGFQNTRALVEVDKHLGYINIDGEFVWQPTN